MPPAPPRTTPLLACILTALAVSGCSKGEWIETSVCLNVADDATACPPTDDLDLDTLWGSGWCETEVRSVNGEGELGPSPYGPFDSGGEGGDLVCCYPATARNADTGCIVGRPFVDEGGPRVAQRRSGSSWGDHAGGTADPLKAAAWSRVAAMEHASVAAFARLTLDLLALGAPPSLLADVQQAALDEVEHARLAYALASRFTGAPVGPGPFPFAGPVVPNSSRVEVAVAAVREGCLGETAGAWLARQEAERATDPQERAALERIADDEARHAALSWRLVAWLIQEGGEPVREAVSDAFALPFPVGAALGPVSAEDCERLQEEVLRPALSLLLRQRPAEA